MARQRSSAPRQFSRTDRIGELMREIVASELERIGDERLEMVTITAVKVDGSLEHADVFYSAMSAEEEGRSEEVAEALDELRWPIQKIVNREVRTRKTPQIQFRPDLVLSSALRIDEILRGMSDRGELDDREPLDSESPEASTKPVQPEAQADPSGDDGTHSE